MCIKFFETVKTKMWINLFVVLSLMCFFTTINGQAADNPCTQASDCSSCLKAGGRCYWCADSDFTDGTNARRPRCNAKPTLQTSGCKKIVIEDGSVKFTVNNKFDSIVQVRPQKVQLRLRKDQTQTFKLTVRPAKDFPVQLYYLMDMSRSMDDDLTKLKTLGTKIAEEIKTITANYSLGFGTFVDKTVSPFVQIEKLNQPCLTESKEPCMPTFGYKHNFDFDKDAKKFEAAVSRQKISGNLDTPEGGFDALMQVAVCSSKLGWADVTKSRRIVVFVTDASPHIAGDGKLGGITVPNDGACHLQDIGSVEKRYTKSNEQDYPSISLLKSKLKENKIVPIFAVTKDAYGVYQKLSDEWKDLLAAIGVLERDSSNIVDLIRDKYKSISTTARLGTDKLPKGVIVNFKVQPGCPNSNKNNECTDMKVNTDVEFEVGVTAVTCPKDWKTDDRSFKITIPVFGDVEVTIKMICDCDCETKTTEIEENSAKCNGTGAYKCGICYCNEGRFGKKCQCNSKDQADQSLCKRNDTESEGLICSGFGSCICGKCECNRREIEGEFITGRYCECNNFGCPRYEGKVCGGPGRGVCECGRCICKEAFLGENCGAVDCTAGRVNCISDLATNTVCNKNGKCACDRCECDTGYKGELCEKCVSCPGKCSDSKDCVRCLAFGEPNKEFCDKLDCSHINWKWINSTKEQCAFKDDNECYVIFSFQQDLISGNETVLVQREKRCIVVVKKEINILAIVLGIIGGIVLLGLILLLLWKLLITAYDNYEYHKFEKDRMKSNWQTGENPIYKPSNQKFTNPTFAGNK
ncbi:integrin beta-1-A-like isoform X2 [Hydractinia symbiolongicarpus]|uniref:integrin beta-1-A-like isoform X2 n=1 Tax=Hydractinia symbiolongicarpus TaxID=13093 RepID=UPI00254BD437|nr:integrin beta-1-A-like isoform X2 [Hydractinia symbiolongicarpus]